MTHYNCSSYIINMFNFDDVKKYHPQENCVWTSFVENEIILCISLLIKSQSGQTHIIIILRWHIGTVYNNIVLGFEIGWDDVASKHKEDYKTLNIIALFENTNNIMVRTHYVR